MKAALVVGGGIAGIQAALDLAESGIKTYLVEKGPSIGGRMAQLDKTFPTNDCSMCILSPKMVDASRHKNIVLLTNAELKDVSGSAGNFKVKIIKHPRYVDEAKCTGCGACAEACIQKGKIANDFDFGLAKRGAAYVQFPQAVPLKYMVDAKKCIFLTKGKCGKAPACREACKAGAVNFEQKAEEIDIDVGGIVLAPGYDTFDATLRPEYGYGVYENVITSQELERFLSASGPTQGKVLRPSDKAEPKRIAFIQCVGSRDAQKGREYCSAVCCMYGMKEAIIAKEHEPHFDLTFFYMDIRSHGKEFEYYYEKAKKDYGIKFKRSRAASVEETQNKNLIVRYVENGEVKGDEFDLVVLSVGLGAPKDAAEISKKLGIALNKYGFCSTKTFAPLNTSVEGIYAGGAFTAPMDIPDSVAQASGASVKAVALCDKHEIIEELPPEKDVKGEPPRIGVIICHCGFNIASVVDVMKVVEYAKTLPNVVHAETAIYACSQDALRKIKDRVAEHKLNRIIVASCSPRTHEPLFRSTIREAGLNPYLFEMANIRDQCSWVHSKAPALATEKAKDLVRMSVAKAQLLEPLKKISSPVNHAALVIGGGIAGMTAALDLSKCGYETHIVEKSAELGGNLRKLRYVLSGEDPQKMLEEVIKKVKAEKGIHVYTNAKIKGIDGYVGNFNTKILVNGTEKKIEHGAVIVAVGGAEYKPKEYLYGQDERVMTQLEFEDKLHAGKVNAKNVVMIQCVGSRNEERPYCSRICCSTAVKNALKMKEKNPNANVYVLYKDVRTYGFKEDYYKEAAERGVIFIRYDDEHKPEVSKDGSGIKVVAYEPVLGKKVEINPDVLVLSAAILPNEDNFALGQMLKVPLSRDKYFLEAHMKLRPVDFAVDGVFLCGLAHSPRSIEETISQASGAAARASTILSKKQLEAEGITASVDETICSGCGVCEETCPYKAIELYDKIVPAAVLDAMKDMKIRVARVNETLCKGCGACSAACPSKAIQQRGFKNDQIVAMVDASSMEA
jgi:heterodisulfide reductase subunit A